MALINRRRFLQGAAGFVGGGVALAGYSTVVEAGIRLELTPYTVSPPSWPDDLTLKIAVIADIHACEPWMSAERIASIVDLANAQQPDLTVLLGDFVVAHRFITGYVAPGAWAAELARLQAPLGVYSVLGNHDWWSAAIPTEPRDYGRSIRKALAEAKIPVLENRSLRLAQNGKPFWLVGLGDQLAYRRGHYETHGADDLAGSLREIRDDAPAILLAHEPNIFSRVPDRVALTLCGHTHGGQIYLPFIGAPLAPKALQKYLYGCYREGARQLVVSGGLGESFAPMRFLRPPEVVTVTVTGGARQSV
ncbi:MAG TPA: metallophosphoesterase [Roseiarcus sp.]|nr:metallophosphoesterase [Roseiarcus sp.]